MTFQAYVSSQPEFENRRFYAPGQVFWADDTSPTPPARWVRANAAQITQSTSDANPMGPPSGGAGSYQGPITQILTGSSAPTLGNLSLSAALTNGTATSGAILGATAGSTITSGISGLTVNSSARTFAFDGTSAAGTTTSGLIETLNGALGSPRPNPITVAPAGGTPIIVTLTMSPIVQRSGSAFLFTAMRSGDTSAPASLPYRVAGIGSSPALASDFGGTFPSGMANFLAGAATTQITVPQSPSTTALPG